VPPGLLLNRAAPYFEIGSLNNYHERRMDGDLKKPLLPHTLHREEAPMKENKGHVFRNAAFQGYTPQYNFLKSNCRWRKKRSFIL
jgi:hypothetical protein